MRYVWQTFTIKLSNDHVSQTFLSKDFTGNLGGGTICGYVGTDYTVDAETQKAALVSPVPIYWSATSGSGHLTSASTVDYPCCALETGFTDRLGYLGQTSESKLWTGGYARESSSKDQLGLRLNTSESFMVRTVVKLKGDALGYKTAAGSGYYPQDGPSGELWTVYLGADDIDPVSVSCTPADAGPGENFRAVIEPRKPIYDGEVYYQYYYAQNGGKFTPIGEKTTETSMEFTFPATAKTYQVAVQAFDDMGYASPALVEGPVLSQKGLKAYVGIGGTARQLRKMYIGVNGKAREIKAAYIGVGGKARKIF